MNRYLLFDSGCSHCSNLAKAIEQEVDGKMVIRSLHDSAMKELLNRECPGWRWEPMLVEERGDQVRVFRGGAMSRQLIKVLGLRRMRRIARLVRVTETNSLANSNGRRAFLHKAGVSAISLVLLPSFGFREWRSMPVFGGKSANGGFGFEKSSQAINVARQSPALQIESERLRHSIAIAHPKDDNVAIVIHSDEDLYSDAMPNRLVITLVDLYREQYLASIPILVSSHVADQYELLVRDDSRKGAFVISRQGALISQDIVPLQANDGIRQVIAPSIINDPIVTGCNVSCICALVCGSIPIWYCYTIGLIGTPGAVVVCGIVWLVICSWMCSNP